MVGQGQRATKAQWVLNFHFSVIKHSKESRAVEVRFSSHFRHCQEVKMAGTRSHAVKSKENECAQDGAQLAFSIPCLGNEPTFGEQVFPSQLSLSRETSIDLSTAQSDLDNSSPRRSSQLIQVGNQKLIILVCSGHEHEPCRDTPWASGFLTIQAI